MACRSARTAFRVAVAALTLAAAFLHEAPATAGDGDGCVDVALAVALAPGEPPNYSVYGLLCQPASAIPSTIQVFVSGATEGGPAYWDFPHAAYYRSDPGTYLPLRERLDTGR